MKGTMSISYDKEGDYLEIMFGEPCDDYGDAVKEDVVLFKSQKTDEVIGVGIFNFSLQTQELRDVELALPIEVSLSKIVGM